MENYYVEADVNNNTECERSLCEAFVFPCTDDIFLSCPSLIFSSLDFSIPSFHSLCSIDVTFSHDSSPPIPSPSSSSLYLLPDPSSHLFFLPLSYLLISSPYNSKFIAAILSLSMFTLELPSLSTN